MYGVRSSRNEDFTTCCVLGFGAVAVIGLIVLTIISGTLSKLHQPNVPKVWGWAAVHIVSLVVMGSLLSFVFAQLGCCNNRNSPECVLLDCCSLCTRC